MALLGEGHLASRVQSEQVSVQSEEVLCIVSRGSRGGINIGSWRRRDVFSDTLLAQFEMLCLGGGEYNPNAGRRGFVQ